jgi:hypothetical protein
MVTRRKPSVSSQLRRLALLCRENDFSCGQVIGALGRQGNALAVAAFSLPFLLPIPLPGLSFILGSIICVLGIAIALDMPVLLPRWISRRAFPGKLLSKPLLIASRILYRIEPWLKPRLGWVFSWRFIKVCAGLVIVVGGSVVLLPLPPGANFISSFICIVVALGLMARDGLVLIGGILLFFSKIGLYIGTFSYVADWAAKYFGWS